MTRGVSFKWLFFDSIAKRCISNQTKTLWLRFFAEIVDEIVAEIVSY